MILKVQGHVGRCDAINRHSAVNFVHAAYSKSGTVRCISMCISMIIYSTQFLKNCPGQQRIWETEVRDNGVQLHMPILWEV